MQRQRSPVEAVVTSQPGPPSAQEQLAAELPGAPGGAGGIARNAGAGPGAAALGHTGGHSVGEVHDMPRRVSVCVSVCADQCACSQYAGDCLCEHVCVRVQA